MRPRRRVATVAQGPLDRPRALQRPGHTLGRQPSVDFLGARPAAAVQGFGGLAQGSGVEVETVAQHMDGGATPGAGQLDAVDQFDTESSGRLVGFRQAFQGVVVGQRQQPDAPFSWARCTRAAGARTPSEAVLWQCRSTRMAES